MERDQTKKQREKGLDFNNFKDLTCGKVAELSKELTGESCQSQFKQFLNNTQSAPVATIPQRRDLSPSFAECGELRSYSKCKNAMGGETPTFPQAQDFLEVLG